MSATRPFVDRLMRAATPRAIPDFAPPPQAVAPGLWALDRHLRLPPGLRLPTRSFVIRLSSGGLLLVSPPPLAAGGLEAVDALGPVEEILVPNSYHYVYAAELAAHYPHAVLRLAPGVRQRAPEAPAGEEVDGAAAPPSWDGTVAHRVLVPAPGIAELALFHIASASLILTDLAFNMVRYPNRLQQLLWRANGVPADFGPSRTARLLLLRDRAAAAEFLAGVLAWPFTRVLMAHGDPLEHDAAATFRRAFAPHLRGE